MPLSVAWRNILGPNGQADPPTTIVPTQWLAPRPTGPVQRAAIAQATASPHVPVNQDGSSGVARTYANARLYEAARAGPFRLRALRNAADLELRHGAVRPIPTSREAALSNSLHPGQLYGDRLTSVSIVLGTRIPHPCRAHHPAGGAVRSGLSTTRPPLSVRARCRTTTRPSAQHGVQTDSTSPPR